MRQVFRRVIDRQGVVVLEDCPVPAITETEVLIESRYSVISTGTEGATLGKTPVELARLALVDPWMRQAVTKVVFSSGVLGATERVAEELRALRVLGYSGSGRVLAVGRRVLGIAPGDRVAYAGHGHAEVVKASRNLVVPVPPDVDLRQAAFCTLGAIAMQGLRRAEVALGERVAVMGLGLVGQLVTRLLLAAGAVPIGVEIDPTRIQAARAAGMRLWVDASQDDPVRSVLALTEDIGADAVIICAASRSPDLANQAMEMSRAQGRVVVVGIVPMELERMPFFRKELDFRFSRAYGPGVYDAEYEAGRGDYPIGYVRWSARRNLEAFIGLLAEARMDLGPLIGASFSIEQAQEAYDHVLGHTGPSVAALFDYPEAADPAQKFKTRVEIANAQGGARPGKLRVGLIGCGNHARTALLPALRACDDAQLVAIAASSGEKAIPMGRKYRAAWITSDYHELLRSEAIDAVIVATRHDLHARIAIDALGAGKHVLCEKPMGSSPEEVEAVADAARASGRYYMTGHNRRFARLAILARKTLGAGPAVMNYIVNVGRIPTDHWTLAPKEGGGRLIGESDHFVDLMNLFAGSRLARVSGACSPRPQESADRSCNFTLTLRYDNGALGILTYSDRGGLGFPRETLTVMKDGCVALLQDFRRLRITGARALKQRLWRTDLGHERQLSSFVRVCLGREEPVKTLEDNLEAARAVFLAAASMEDQGPREVEHA